MDVIIGIDPGIKGAIGVLSLDTHELVDLIDMPTKQVLLKSGKKRTAVDALQLAAFIKKYVSETNLCKVVIEQVGTRPGEGAVGAFSFGTSFGVLVGVFGGFGIEPTMIMPATWKKAMGLTGLSKEETTAIAHETYPMATLYSTRKNKQGGYNALDGRGDAILIAMYAIKQLGK